MKIASIGFVIFLIAFLLVSVWRYHHLGQSSSDSVERTRILMDTLVRIEVFDENEEEGRAAIDAAYGEIDRLSKIFSYLLPESEVSRLNRIPPGEPWKASPELYTVLERSKYFSNVIPDGFDITIGAVSHLWDFTAEHPTVPQARDVAERLVYVDIGNIRFDEERRVSLADSMVAIDLGGVAKGYSVDRAVEVLQEHGISRALVDAGGDIGLLGRKENNQPWRIGVQHPRDATELFAIIEVDSGSVATSGDYQRFFFQDGQRYHHILDPGTGWPSRECISVTILARETTDADILATGIFVLGPERGLRVVERMEGVEGLILFQRDGQIEYVVSTGLQDKIEFN